MGRRRWNKTTTEVEKGTSVARKEGKKKHSAEYREHRNVSFVTSVVFVWLLLVFFTKLSSIHWTLF